MYIQTKPVNNCHFYRDPWKTRDLWTTEGVWSQASRTRGRDGMWCCCFHGDVRWYCSAWRAGRVVSGQNWLSRNHWRRVERRDAWWSGGWWSQLSWGWRLGYWPRDDAGLAGRAAAHSHRSDGGSRRNAAGWWWMPCPFFETCMAWTVTARFMG